MIKRVSLFDTFRKAMISNPKASAKEQFDAFMETVRSDLDRYVVSLGEDYFFRQLKSWQAVEVAPGSFTVAATPSRRHADERAAQTRSEGAARRQREVESLKSKLRDVLLLDVMMPNGKKARHCTGAELRKAGGFWTEVARHVGSRNILDRKLSEAELHNVRERYFKDAQPESRQRRAAPESRPHVR